MNTQAKLKRDHYLSVAISVVINGGLMLALLHFITLGTQSEPDLSTALVLDTADEVLIEEIEEEIIREEIEIDDLQDLDFNNNDFDIPFESDFTEDIEVINAPADATDVSQLTELLSDIASPVVMHGIMPGRTALAMQQARARFGGSDATEAAVQRALRWLARVQLSDGSWDQAGNPNARNGGTGWTGLALLTFLSNGQTPSSAEYGSTVSRAIRYLVENQTRDGMIWNSSSRHQTYAHAIATYALAEAYTMTNNMLLREPVQRAAQFMIRHQLPDGGFRGPSGYRYDGNPGQADYRAIKYDTYGALLPKPDISDEITDRDAIPTTELLTGESSLRNKAELQWRMSLPILVFIVTLMAVPLSRVNPRQGRFLKLLPAILLYMAYLTILIAARGALEKGKIPGPLGLWWVHAIFLFIGLGLLYWEPLRLKMKSRRDASEVAHV